MLCELRVCDEADEPVAAGDSDSVSGSVAVFQPRGVAGGDDGGLRGRGLPELPAAAVAQGPAGLSLIHISEPTRPY